MLWVPMRVVGDLAWQPVQLPPTLTSFSISYAAASLVISVVADETESFTGSLGALSNSLPRCRYHNVKANVTPGRKYKNFECKNFNCETLAVTYTRVADVDKLL